MPNNPFIVTDWSSHIDARIRYLDVWTDLAADLTLIAQPLEPTQTPRYIKRRGVWTPCGFTITWRPTLRVPQQPPGPSLFHRFPVPCYATDTTWHLTLSSGPTLEKPYASLPPTALNCQPVPVASASINPAGNLFGLINPTSTQPKIWGRVEASFNWPHGPGPFGSITSPITGTSAGHLALHVGNIGVGQLVARIVKDPGAIIVFTYTYTLHGDNPALLEFDYELGINAGQGFTVTIENRTAGFALMQPPGSPEDTWTCAVY